MIAPVPTSLDRLTQRRAVYPPRPSTQLSDDQPSGMIRRIVSKHPTIALATAGLIGLTLGWLVKRRSL